MKLSKFLFLALAAFISFAAHAETYADFDFRQGPYPPYLAADGRFFLYPSNGWEMRADPNDGTTSRVAIALWYAAVMKARSEGKLISVGYQDVAGNPMVKRITNLSQPK